MRRRRTPRRPSRRKSPGFAGLAIVSLLLGLALLGADIEMLDSINIAAPVWIALALAYLLRSIWINLRRDRRANAVVAGLLGLAYIALAGLLMRPLWNGVALARGDERAFRVVSFNLNKDNPHQAAAAAWIKTESPDFVILVEARDTPGSVRQLLKPIYPYQYACRGDGRCSTVILSRTQAQSVEYHARGDTENRRSISALTARFEHSGKSLAITAVHMPRPWPLGKQTLRLRELAAVATVPDGTQIVAGDFNNVPWTFAMNRLAVDMGLRLMSRATPSWTTAWGGWAPLPLDNIYGRGCLRLVDLARGPNLGSDHYPLVMTARMGDCDA